MRSTTFFIAFLAVALFYALCDALPHEANIGGDLPDNTTFTDTGVSRVDPPSWLSPEVDRNLNRCYYTDVSETWNDVGGKQSQFVHDSVYRMCDVIATYASNTGFPRDSLMRICVEVPKDTNGKDYARSIGVIVAYRGPDESFYPDAKYLYNLMASSMECGAGGEFLLPYGDPTHWWEVKADPNRNDCESNHYITVL